MFLGDFAAFYLIPMCLYVILYTRIAFTLKESNLAVKQTPKSSLSSTPQKRSSRGASQKSATVDVSKATTGAKDSDPDLNRRFSAPESPNRLNSLESNGELLNPDRPVVLRTNNQLHPKTSLQLPTRTTSMMASMSASNGPRDTFVSGGRQTSSKGRNQVRMAIESASSKLIYFQVVKMLAVIVAVFAICWLPYRAMVMYNSFATTRWDPDW